MNRSYSHPVVRSISVIGVACALLTPSCGGSQPEPETPGAIESPPPSVAPAPVESAASTPPPAASAEPAPEPRAERRKGHRHHGMAAMLLMNVKSLELKPAQKTEVSAIEADLE